MFSHQRTILYLTANELRVATGDIRTATVLQSDYLSLEHESLPEAIRSIEQHHTKPVRFIIPEEYLYLTQIKIDSQARTRSQIAAAIEDIFPEALSEIAWDYEILSEEDNQLNVEVSGVTKEFGSLLTEALAQSILRLEAVIPESYALARVVPFSESVVLIHKRGEGAMLCLAKGQKIVSAITLHHDPSQIEVREFIDFGKEHKQCSVEKIVLSGFTNEGDKFSVDTIPVVTLDLLLDPIHGALLLNPSSSRDADRLDLPLRGRPESWFRRIRTIFS